MSYIKKQGTTIAIQWSYPFAYRPVTITSRYGPRVPPGPGASDFHKGLDFAPGAGVIIVAAASGTVTVAGPNGTFGNYVRIDHGEGYASAYAHMQTDSILVSVGQSVAAGTPLGKVGNTGNSFGAHLHFEILSNGSQIDPAPFVENAQPATESEDDLTPEQDARMKNIEAILAIDNGGGIRAITQNTLDQARQANSRVGAQRDGAIADAVWGKSVTGDGKSSGDVLAQTWSRSGTGASRASTIIAYVEAVAAKVGAILPSGLTK